MLMGTVPASSGHVEDGTVMGKCLLTLVKEHVVHRSRPSVTATMFKKPLGDTKT